MKLLSSALLSISLLDATFPLVSHGQTAPADATPNSPSITIVHSGSQAPQKGPTDRFTGSVRIQPLFGARAPSHTSGGLVTFEPGARSAWHSHPVGQVLIVTAGTGWIQTWGGPIQEFHQGDIVLIPPGVKRWHGASPTSSMTHIAIQEESDGSNTTWMEKVSDAQYSQGPADTKKPLKSQGELRVAQGHVRYRGRKRNFQTLAATSNHSREDLSYEHIL